MMAAAFWAERFSGRIAPSRNTIRASFVFIWLARILHRSHRMVISMPKKINFETVRKIGLSLPDVEEGTTYGVAALKIRGKLFTCPAIHSSAEPGSLIIPMSIGDRDELIAS